MTRFIKKVFATAIATGLIVVMGASSVLAQSPNRVYPDQAPQRIEATFGQPVRALRDGVQPVMRGENTSDLWTTVETGVIENGGVFFEARETRARAANTEVTFFRQFLICLATR